MAWPGLSPQFSSQQIQSTTPVSRSQPARTTTKTMPSASHRTFLAFTLWSLAGATFAQTAPLPARENFQVFLLIGQSNMAGRGTVTPADQVPHPRVLMFNGAGEWVPAVDPMHCW
jgi:hypothetical protein